MGRLVLLYVLQCGVMAMVVSSSAFNKTMTYFVINTDDCHEAIGQK